MVTDDELREAFIAGFMETGEGMNGEYVRNGRPRDVAEKRADQFLCEHVWAVVDVERARDGLKYRECGECEYHEYVDVSEADNNE